MLERNKKIGPPETGAPDDSLSFAEIIDQLSGFVRRQFPILLVVTACAISLGLVYLITAPARYTAHARMLIDSSKLQGLQTQALSDIPLDTEQVETQLEIMRSENIGLSVIKDMHLTEDPEFIGTGGGFIGAVFGLLSSASSLHEPKSENQLSRMALGTFLGQRVISRVGRTYVLDIAYTSLSPARAAGVANGIADAYITDQLEAKYYATRRASAWLQDRIKELVSQATIADRAVLDYKEKNNIVDAGASNTAPGGGRLLIGEQRLTELNAQLSTARGAKAEAKAKLDRIDDVLKQDIPDAGVADSLHSEVINRLRNQYLDMAARERIWSERYGSTHLAAVNLRMQMSELRRSMTDEIGRIAESYKSDYKIAEAREKDLETGVSGLISEQQLTNRDRLGLRDLESQAQVYHTIHDNFLQHYMEAIQQESFPITEARVISAAVAPSGKSGPKTFFILAIAGSLGLILSFAAAYLREVVDRVFRTTRQVEEILQTNCLAVLPVLKNLSSVVLDSKGSPLIKENREKTEMKRRVTSHPREFLRYVIDEPLSSFTESFRSIKVAADINRDIKENKVIGVTSTIPKEGKSTISCNLALSIAHAGKRAILIDGDLRNPSVTRSLTPNANIGLLEVLAGKVELSQAAIKDEETGLMILPAIVGTRRLHTDEILASEGFKRLIEGLRKAYDYIIIDLPPIAPVVDVRVTTRIVDCYIYVIQWGSTKISLVQHQLEGAPEIYNRLLGVVLNKADIKILDRYEYYSGGYNQTKYYARYGYVA